MSFKSYHLTYCNIKGHPWESPGVDPYGLLVFFPVTFLWRLCICPILLHSPGANCCLLDLATVYRDHMLSPLPTRPRLRYATWPCCPQIRTCCCLTTTAGNVLPWRAYLAESRAELWHSRQAHRMSGFSGGSSWWAWMQASCLEWIVSLTVDTFHEGGIVCWGKQEVQEWHNHSSSNNQNCSGPLGYLFIYLFILG